MKKEIVILDVQIISQKVARRNQESHKKSISRGKPHALLQHENPQRFIAAELESVWNERLETNFQGR
jgi:hypothetical protein